MKLTSAIFVAALVYAVNAWAAPRWEIDSEAFHRTASAVMKNISEIPDLGRYEIEVHARQGVATLTGQVSTEERKARIEQVARETKGVRVVRNYLRVNREWVRASTGLEPKIVPPPEPDESLAGRVKDTLQRENKIPMEGITVSANQGIITFEGVRANHREVDHILSVALMIDGVRDVHNKIRLGKSEIKATTQE